MRFNHTIETCDNAEDPIWCAVIQGDKPEEHEGTAAGYGREVLRNWIDDEQPKVTDEYGNPHLRVLVHFEGDDYDAVATVYSDDLAEPPAELTAVEAARDAKLYARHLDNIADLALEEALAEARAAGHGANFLARLVDGAVSRPVALRMMR